MQVVPISWRVSLRTPESHFSTTTFIGKQMLNSPSSGSAIFPRGISLTFPFSSTSLSFTNFDEMFARAARQPLQFWLCTFFLQSSMIPLNSLSFIEPTGTFHPLISCLITGVYACAFLADRGVFNLAQRSEVLTWQTLTSVILSSSELYSLSFARVSESVSFLLFKRREEINYNSAIHTEELYTISRSTTMLTRAVEGRTRAPKSMTTAM